MVIKLAVVWMLVLLTLVPYAIYYLLYKASSNEYAFLISFILFWVFGFWGIAGPIITMVKVRRIFNAFKEVKSPEEFRELIQSSDAKEVAVELIASENHIPKFLAKRVYNLILHHLSKAGESQDQTKDSFLRELR